MSNIINYNYFCQDCTCELNRSTFVLELTEQEHDENDVRCPNNTQLTMKCLGYNPSGGYMKFKALSANEKTAVLQKRATKHFNKQGEEEKREVKKTILKKFQ